VNRNLALLVVALAFSPLFAHAQAKDIKYNCTAKGKKGSGNAASVITAKSESYAVEAMKKRWPGYSSYACAQAR
jgi:hypothetical protein